MRYMRDNGAALTWLGASASLLPATPPRKVACPGALPICSSGRGGNHDPTSSPLSAGSSNTCRTPAALRPKTRTALAQARGVLLVSRQCVFLYGGESVHLTQGSSEHRGRATHHVCPCLMRWTGSRIARPTAKLVAFYECTGTMT